LTGRAVKSERRPNELVEGNAPIRDGRVDRLCELYQPKSKVYAINRFVLCPDAAVGGESYEWLAAAAKCDLLCLVLRAFDSEQVYHPAGSVDAERDRVNIETELILSDLQIVEKRLERIAKESRAGLSPEQKLEQQTLEQCRELLESERPLLEGQFEPQQLAVLRNLSFVTNKPLLKVCNVSEDDLARDFGPDSISVSCLIEQEISELESVDEQREYMQSLGLSSSGVDRVNAASYDALGLMSFYTTGKDECRAWTIRKGSPAPVAGGKIHSDIERGFIRVEVMKFDDLIAAGSEQKLKEKGLLQTRGKDYIIEDGDICHFLFNV
jgi:ribosome-binding ATPase